jgi:DNA mismatch endonuclease (patch repair protein)
MTAKRAPLSRSEIMSRVRGKHTKPEMTIRLELHARGYRYRLHRKDLPGTPDIVLPRHRAVIDVRGCFWHGHPDCGRRPKTRQEFWNAKIDRNRARDQANERALMEAGWRVLVVWECCMVGRGRWDPGDLLDTVEDWLLSDQAFAELSGADAGHR